MTSASSNLNESSSVHRTTVAYLIPLTEQDELSDGTRWLARFFQRKLPIVTGIVLGIVAAIIYVITSRPIYRVEAILEPNREQGLNLSGLGGLLGDELGVILGNNDSNTTDLALSLMRSDTFLATFITERDLLPTLYPRKWDAQTREWNGRPPTLWRAVDRFRSKVLHITENKRTGLIQMSIDWPDANQGSEMLIALVKRVNEQLRQRRLRDLSRSIDYLRREFDAADNVEVRQAIAKVLEARLGEASVVSTREDYALVLLDEPMIPPADEHISPRWSRSLVIGTGGGLMLGLLASLVLYVRDSRRTTSRA